jgi:hypothetical protein
MTFSQVAFTQENEYSVPSPPTEEEVQSMRSKQYTLSFTSFIGKDCQVAIFSNKTLEHFILKRFQVNARGIYRKYMDDQDENLLKEKDKKVYAKILKGKTQNYSFHMDGGNLVIGYELLNKELNQYTKEFSILEKNLNCRSI